MTLAKICLWKDSTRDFFFFKMSFFHVPCDTTVEKICKWKHIQIDSREDVNDCFRWKCHIPETHQVEKLRFLGVSRYKFKLRFCFNLNLYRGICVFGFGRFQATAFPVESHAHLIFYTELRWLDDEIYILYRNNTYTHARFIFHTERKRLYRIFFISYKNNTYAHAYFMFYTEIKWLCRKTNILYRKKLYTHAHFMFNTEMKWLCTKTIILYRKKLYTQITLYFIQK